MPLPLRAQVSFQGGWGPFWKAWRAEPTLRRESLCPHPSSHSDSGSLCRAHSPRAPSWDPSSRPQYGEAFGPGLWLQGSGDWPCLWGPPSLGECLFPFLPMLRGLLLWGRQSSNLDECLQCPPSRASRSPGGYRHGQPHCWISPARWSEVWPPCYTVLTERAVSGGTTDFIMQFSVSLTHFLSICLFISVSLSHSL